MGPTLGEHTLSLFKDWKPIYEKLNSGIILIHQIFSSPHRKLAFGAKPLWEPNNSSVSLSHSVICPAPRS